jgi:uncharacterized protein (UPF0276 family)
MGARPLLGANGTEAMQALLNDDGGGAGGAEAGAVDYLKVGPFMGHEAVAELAARYPLMLHLDDTLSGHEPPDDETMARLEGWVRLTGTPWTSEHIGFGAANVDLSTLLITQASSGLLPYDVALANIIRNARALARGLSVPLLLENIPLFPNAAHLHVCEPEFVSTVIAETGCDMLLDLAHARVSADVLGMDVRDYLSQLPLDRVVELHLSGPRRLGEVDPARQEQVRREAAGIAHLLPFGDANLMDAHEPMGEADYALLGWTLERASPRAVSLEYYREPEALRRQLARLNEMLGR